MMHRIGVGLEDLIRIRYAFVELLCLIENNVGSLIHSLSDLFCMRDQDFIGLGNDGFEILQMMGRSIGHLLRLGLQNALGLLQSGQKFFRVSSC